MIFRRILLGIGALAFVFGLALLVLLLRAPVPNVAERPEAPTQTVLVASHVLPTGTLLRADDLHWIQKPVLETPPGAFSRGQRGEFEVLGAATRRNFQTDEILVADQLIKPNEPGFLPAVLAPGMRATSIAVNPAEGGAGLIAPGDRVDIILTQTFTDPSVSATSRSVGETILQNLRIIAIDQTTNLAGGSGPESKRTGITGDARLPKTVTLEVSVRQAEMLMVAGQLGKLQLTLRSLADGAKPASPTVPDPTWASQVSPALRFLSRVPMQSPSPGVDRSPPAAIAIEIIRGSKTERTCYSAQTGQTADCAAAPTTAEPAPRSTAPVEPHQRL